MTIRPATVADLPTVRQCAVDAYGLYVERIGRKPAPMIADFARIQVQEISIFWRMRPESWASSFSIAKTA